MTLVYIAKLGFTISKTSIGAQKIVGLALGSDHPTLIRFSLQNSFGKIRFFKKMFLLANTSMEMILGMPFLSLSNADIKFAKRSKKLTQKSYTTIETLPTTNWVKLINKKKFIKVLVDKDLETFVVHMVVLEAETLIHFSQAV